MKRIISILLTVLFVASAAVALGIGISAAEPTFTDVDLSKLTYVHRGTDAWSCTTDSGTQILKQTQKQSGQVYNDSIALTDVTLTPGNNYTFEVKARFAEKFTSGSADTRGFGIIFGAQGEDPWNTGAGGKSFCGMVDRASGTGKHVRFFNVGYSGSTVNNIGQAFTAEQMAKTDWFTMRITVSALGEMKLYLDGEEVASVTDGEKWIGGKLGLITYGVRTSVEFKEFKYAEESVGNTYKLTVHYVNSDGTKAFDDYVKEGMPSGTAYSVDTTPKMHYTADKATVSGTITADTEITVTYTPVKYKLTIHYVDENGNKVADDHVSELEYKSAYNIASPTVDGMVPDKANVKSNGINKNVEVKVTYKSDGSVVAESETAAETEISEKVGGCGSTVGVALMLPVMLAGTAVLVKRRMDD